MESLQTCARYPSPSRNVILLRPTIRSENVYGTSTIFAELVRTSSSNPILNPREEIVTSDTSDRRTRKKPDVGSRTSVSGRANQQARRDMNRRRRGQTGVPPPGM